MVPAPPGPEGHRWSGNLAAYEQDRLGFLMQARDDFGPVVAFDRVTTIVNHPGLALDVLARHDEFQIQGNFRNQRLDDQQVAATTARRRHLNPGLRAGLAQRASGPASRHVSAAVQLAVAASDTLDLVPVLEEALSRTVATFYFGAGAEHVRTAVEELLDALSDVFGNPFTVPAWVPSLRRRRVDHLYRRLHQLVGQAIRTVGAEPHAETPYVGTVAVACREAGESAEATIDLVIGSLLAAQRVPAAGAAWTLLAIAADAGLQTTLSDEIRAASRAESDPLPGRGPTSLLDRVILEVLRLHPPTWMMQRTVSRPAVLGDYTFPAGHHVLISPYVIHRDPVVYDQPHVFAHDRWRQPSPKAYLPFGHGVRACPGTNLAMVLLRATVTAVLAQWKLTSTGPPPTPDPRSTLLPRGAGLRLVRREPGELLSASTTYGECPRPGASATRSAPTLPASTHP